MITIKEIYKDINDNRPFKIEVGNSKLASTRCFVDWVRNNRPSSFADINVLRMYMYIVPSLIREFIDATGCSLKIDDFGIIKPRYVDDHLCLGLRNDPKVLREMNDRLCDIEMCVMVGPKKVRFKGRLAAPKSLARK